MPHIVSTIQSKGGTGKTTTAMFLAAALTESGHDVAVLDMDPQQSTVRWPQHAGNLGFPVIKAATVCDLNNQLRRETSADFIIIDTPPGVS